MEIWHYWIMIGLLFVIIEVFTAGFAFFCLFLGAIAGAIVAGLDYDLEIQLLWFSILTFVSFVTIRPLLMKYLFKSNEELKSNSSALIGRVCVVTEQIDYYENRGRVKIDGDSWRAITLDNQVIEVGEKVIVEYMDSIILTVRKI